MLFCSCTRSLQSEYISFEVLLIISSYWVYNTLLYKFLFCLWMISINKIFVCEMMIDGRPWKPRSHYIESSYHSTLELFSKKHCFWSLRIRKMEVSATQIVMFVPSLATFIHAIMCIFWESFYSECNLHCLWYSVPKVTKKLFSIL